MVELNGLLIVDGGVSDWWRRTAIAMKLDVSNCMHAWHLADESAGRWSVVGLGRRRSFEGGGIGVNFVAGY